MLEIQEDKKEITTPDKTLKKWKSKIENKTLDTSDLISYIELSAPYFFTVTRKDTSISSENSESLKIHSYLFRYISSFPRVKSTVNESLKCKF
jgi:hypothetical protein